MQIFMMGNAAAGAGAAPRVPDHRTAVAANCTLRGSSLDCAIVEVESRFFIVAAGANGQHFKVGGEHFHVECKPPADKEKVDVPVRVTDNRNGMYVVEHKPPRAGRYAFSITLGGEHVKGSPLIVDAWRAVETFAPATARSLCFASDVSLHVLFPRTVSVFGLERVEGPEFKLKKSSEYGNMSDASGIASGRDGVLMCTDSYLSGVCNFRDGVQLYRWGYEGRGEQEMESPCGIATDNEVRLVYVVDTGNRRCQVYRDDNLFVRAFGSPGNGNGQFVYPRHVTVAQSRVFISDSGSHRVQVFGTDGAFLFKFGSFGSAPGQFHSPRGIAFSERAANLIFVCDTVNNRVQAFTMDGEFSYSWRVKSPEAIAVNGSGIIAVTGAGALYLLDMRRFVIQALADVLLSMSFDVIGVIVGYW